MSDLPEVKPGQLPALDPAATAFTVFRIVDDEGQEHTVAEPKNDRGLLARTLHVASRIGYVTVSSRDSFAILDVLDDEDSIVQDYGIPSARAFLWWREKLGVRAGVPASPKEDR